MEIHWWQCKEIEKTEREFAKEKRIGVMNSRMGDRTEERRCGN